MLHEPPPKKEVQTIQSVITDMEKQISALQGSIGWLKNIAARIAEFSNSGTLRYRNVTPIDQDTRWVNLAVSMPAGNSEEDIGVVTVAGSFSQEELHRMLDGDDLASIDALRFAKAQQWMKQYSVRPFDVWTVPEKMIWQGTQQHTIVWLNKQIKAWVKYWFQIDVSTQFSPLQEFRVEKIGQRMIEQVKNRPARW